MNERFYENVLPKSKSKWEIYRESEMKSEDGFEHRKMPSRLKAQYEETGSLLWKYKYKFSNDA